MSRFEFGRSVLSNFTFSRSMKDLPLTFKPYIGKNYHSSTKKILVLGESHYTVGEKPERQLKNLTNSVLEKYLNYKGKRKGIKHEKWMNTFTKFSNVLCGERLTNEGTIKFWEEVTFYNYVQVAMPKSRKSPNKPDFEKSYTSFKDVLKEIQPKIIIIWGFRLWRNLPKENFIVNEENERIFKGTLLDLNGNTTFLVVPHPSSSFSYRLTDPIQKGLLIG